MTLNEKRFRRLPASGSQIRRHAHGRLFELKRAVEEGEHGRRVGCLPDNVATLLIARIAKRGAFHLGVAVSHVR